MSTTERPPEPSAIAWLGSTAAADYLGITLRTLYTILDEGRLPAYKFGRVIRIKQADIDAYIDVSQVEPGSLGHLHRRKPTRSGRGPDDLGRSVGENRA